MRAGVAATSDGGVRLRVVSYNLHGLKDDRAALDLVVGTLAPDVVVAQEAPRRLRWRARCAQVAHSWGMFYGAGGSPSLGNLVVTGQRVRVRETWHLRFPLTPGRHMRGAVFARCTLGRARFVVVGSHLSTDGSERAGQARLLHDALARIEDPLVVGCDFNETPGGEPWGVLASGLIDVDAVEDRPTFTARNPQRRIDGMLVSPDVEVDGCFVLGTSEAVNASDHLPVVADLRVSASG